MNNTWAFVVLLSHAMLLLTFSFSHSTCATAFHFRYTAPLSLLPMQCLPHSRLFHRTPSYIPWNSNWILYFLLHEEVVEKHVVLWGSGLILYSYTVVQILLVQNLFERPFHPLRPIFSSSHVLESVRRPGKSRWMPAAARPPTQREVLAGLAGQRLKTHYTDVAKGRGR